MAPERKKEYLTETHKVREAYYKAEFWFTVTAVICCFAFSVLFFEGPLKTLYLTPQERLLKEKDPKSVKTPLIITPYHLVKKVTDPRSTASDKIKFASLYVLWNALIVGTAFYVYFAVRKKRSFFFQQAATEEVLPLKEEVVLPLYVTLSLPKPKEKKQKLHVEETLKKYFRDVKKVEKIVNSAVENHQLFREKVLKEYKKFVKDFLKEYERYVNAFYPHLESLERKPYEVVSFLLWHYVINLYGNLPTGVLSSYVVDRDLKYCLSCYQRRILPLIYVRKRVSARTNDYEIVRLTENHNAYFILRSFYEALDFFFKKPNVGYVPIEDKFSPLPFPSPIAW